MAPTAKLLEYSKIFHYQYNHRERNKINSNAYILVSAPVSLYNATTKALCWICYLSLYSVFPKHDSAALLHGNPPFGRTLLLGGWKMTKSCQHGKTDQAKIQTSMYFMFFRHEAKKECCKLFPVPNLELNCLLSSTSFIVHTPFMVWFLLCCTQVILNDPLRIWAQ